MPLFIDRHESQIRRSMTEIAALHEKDVLRGPEFGVHWVTYFCDAVSVYSPDGASVRYTTYCVADAPAKENVQECHWASHESVPNEVIEIDRETLERFLGQLEEPKRLEPWEASAFRTILVSELANPAQLLADLGDRTALETFGLHEKLVRKHVQAKGGREVSRTDYGVMACFVSTAMALECATAIQNEAAAVSEAAGVPVLRVRIGVNAGEPVNSNGDLFGAAVRLARAVCEAGSANSVFVSGVVRDICLGKDFVFTEESPLQEGFAEPVRVFALKWRNEPTKGSPPANTQGLTDREIEVLRLIAAGKSNHQIAEDLVISLNTVARHVTNIFGKTGVSNRTEAATYALRQGLA
jgi:DNA-binding CsgD family transcriptional regulator